MKYIVPGLLASLLLLAPPNTWAQSSGNSSSAAQDADPSSVIPPEMAARYAKAKWTYPSGDRLASLYPEKALQDRLSGITVIACTIDTDGFMNRCGIIAESAKAYGFGQATATAFVKYTHVDPATVEGGIKTGDFKVFTYKWLLN